MASACESGSSQHLEELVGEDRSFGGDALKVDLIPRTIWGGNVKARVTKTDFRRIQGLVFTRAGHCCECCGKQPITALAAQQLQSKSPASRAAGLFLLERWSYNPATETMTLKRLLALCGDCKAAMHMGQAQIQGKGDIALAQLARVNNITLAEAEEQSTEAFSIWWRRSAVEWSTDVSILEDSGIKTRKPKLFVP